MEESQRCNRICCISCDKENGKYKTVKTITKASTTKFKNKKLKKKKTYYYKVRAIKKAGKKVTYSKYSKAVSVKIKK